MRQAGNINNAPRLCQGSSDAPNKQPQTSRHTAIAVPSPKVGPLVAACSSSLGSDPVGVVVRQQQLALVAEVVLHIKLLALVRVPHHVAALAVAVRGGAGQVCLLSAQDVGVVVGRVGGFVGERFGSCSRWARLLGMQHEQSQADLFCTHVCLAEMTETTTCARVA